MYYSNIIDLIGNTPLLSLEESTGYKIYAKAEFLNPGGSIKDRIAKNMIEVAEKEGKVKVIFDLSTDPAFAGKYCCFLYASEKLLDDLLFMKFLDSLLKKFREDFINFLFMFFISSSFL